MLPLSHNNSKETRSVKPTSSLCHLPEALYFQLAEDGLEVLFRGGDRHQVQLVVQHLEYGRGEERRGG